MVERLDFSKLPKGVLVVIDATPTPEQDPLIPIGGRSGFVLITEGMGRKRLSKIVSEVGTSNRRASTLITAPSNDFLGDTRPLENIPSITVEKPGEVDSHEPTTIVHFDWPWDAEYGSEVVRSAIRHARQTRNPLLLEKNHTTGVLWASRALRG